MNLTPLKDKTWISSEPVDIVKVEDEANDRVIKCHIIIKPGERNHLFVVFGEELPTRGLVDGLSDSDDLSIAVADGHAQERLGLVPSQLVDFIAEATILQPAARAHAVRAQSVCRNRFCFHIATHHHFILL